MPRRDTSEGTEESGSICPGSMTAWLDKNCPGPVEVSAEFKRGVYMEDKDPEKFPPPYFLNPFKMKNVGIMMAYFSIGVAIYILTTPVAYYLVDYLDTSSTAYSAYATLISLPWSFKFAFGMITDGNPMFNGYRRKSWLFIGWSLYVLFLFILFLLETPSLQTKQTMSAVPTPTRALSKEHSLKVLAASAVIAHFVPQKTRGRGQT